MVVVVAAVAVAVADHVAVVQVGLESADASWAAVDAEAGVVDEPTPPNDSGSRPLDIAAPADYYQCSCQRA